MKKYKDLIITIVFLAAIVGLVVLRYATDDNDNNVGAEPSVLTVRQGGTGTTTFPALSYLTGNEQGQLVATSTGNFSYFVATSTTASSSIAGGLIVSGGGLALHEDICASAANGGVLTTDSVGNIICEDDDTGAGAVTVNTGTANTLSYYSGATTIDSATNWVYAGGASTTFVGIINTQELYASSTSAFGGLASFYGGLISNASSTITELHTDNLYATSSAMIGGTLYFPSGHVINWNDGDVTLTHSSNLLTISGGNLTVGNLTLASGSITDSGGSISFDNENLSTTGTLSSGLATLGGFISTASSSVAGILYANDSIVSSTTLAAQNGIYSYGTLDVIGAGVSSFGGGFQSSASSSVAGDFTVGDTGLGYFRNGLIANASSTIDSTLTVSGALLASSTIMATNNILTLGSLLIGTTTPGGTGIFASTSAATAEVRHAGDAAVFNVDWTQGNQQVITLTQSETINFSGAIPGQAMRLLLCQDSTGSRVVTWGTYIAWKGQAAPTLTTTAGHCDWLFFAFSTGSSTNQYFGNSSLDY